MARNTLAPGGYIGGEPPRRPYFNQLSGVWKLDDAMERQRAGTWANPLGIEDLFSTYLYTGNDSTQTITNGIDLAGKGGLVWLKSRSASGSQNLFDTNRGNTKPLFSNSTAAEGTNTSTRGLTSFNSNGFTLGTDFNETNTSGVTTASWTFRKAAKFFDVVTWTAGSSTNRRISHSLGSAPGLILIKNYSGPTADNWYVYHRSLGRSAWMMLNQTSASSPRTNAWGTSDPTSSDFGIDETFLTQPGETYVAYLFAHDAGGFGDSGNESVIKCGSFTTDGSGNATVTLGWEPQWLLVKQTAAASGWLLIDTMRGASQTGVYPLSPNSSAAENPSTGAPYWAPTATGFSTTGYWASASVIYIAIRRGPMKAPTDATKVFKANTYTGNGSLLSITGAGFPPDFSFTRRTDGGAWVTTDKLRGAPKSLYAQSTDAEVDNSIYEVRSYDQDGITYGQNSIVNGSSLPHVNHLFRRAPGFFDVVAYTGTGVAGRTIPHNLGVVPELMLVRGRSFNAYWRWYWAPLGATKNFYMPNDEGSVTQTEIWNNTAPTSSVFSLGLSSATNSNGNTFIAYLFATCPGVSKVGSYTGTGTTLSIDCGFTNGARFILIKRADSTGDWYVWNTARGIVSGNDPSLLLNSTAAEVTNTDYIDPYSPGFEISSTAPAAINANGGNFVFLAIA